MKAQRATERRLTLRNRVARNPLLALLMTATSRRRKHRHPRGASDPITLLNEAIAFEAAGGTWSQKHAAAVVGYSPAFLRISDCPKRFMEGHGPKGRARVVYVPAEVRAWKAHRLTKSDGTRDG